MGYRTYSDVAGLTNFSRYNRSFGDCFSYIRARRAYALWALALDWRRESVLKTLKGIELVMVFTNLVVCLGGRITEGERG